MNLEERGCPFPFFVSTKNIDAGNCCIYNKAMTYEWDENKRDANIAKHGVDFTEVEGFDWSSAFIEPDARKNYGEPRHIALGPINGRLHVMVFTTRSSAIRIIGLRKANPREVKRYEEKA